MRRIAVQSFARLRLGDGFSHARATGLQVSLAVMPLVLAVIALGQLLDASWLGMVLRRTILELTPGASDALIRETLPAAGEERVLRASASALVVAAALLALTTAMAQLERGANRIYGIDRDRPTRRKYGRALVMCMVAGLPAMGGSLVLVAGSAFAEAVEEVHGLDDDLVLALTWPAGVALVVGAVTVLLRFAPARRQPGWSLLLCGGVLALLAWTALTLVLAAALQFSSGLGSVYGPLTGVVFLLLWAQLASVAVLLGFAVSAELEAEAIAHRQPSTHELPRRPGNTRARD
jgi:uncharacterized BrkB/YihY/UPF0761 family membrane protein